MSEQLTVTEQINAVKADSPVHQVFQDDSVQISVSPAALGGMTRVRISFNTHGKWEEHATQYLMKSGERWGLYADNRGIDALREADSWQALLTKNS